jgi:predicted nucleic acid-binding protein
MAREGRKIYIDSCLILRYLEDDNEYATPMESVFEQARKDDGNVRLFTCTLSVAEVAYIYELYDDKSRSDDLTMIDDFWRNAPMTIVEVTANAARRGRHIIRSWKEHHDTGDAFNVKKRSIDAIHAGMAIFVEADELWTIDEKFLGINGFVDRVHIRTPHVLQPRLDGV